MSYSDTNDAYARYQSPYRSYPQSTGADDEHYALPAPRQQDRPPASPAPRQSSSAGKRMPKAEVLSLVKKLKRWGVVASVVTFGVIGALALGHVTGVTSQSTNLATPPQATPTSSSQNGEFFQQQQGGYQFGFGSSSQAPVTTSRTS